MRPLLLGAPNPAALVDRAARARLPEDALVTDRRRGLQRCAGEASDPGHGGGTDLVDDDVDARRIDVRHASEILVHTA